MFNKIFSPIKVNSMELQNRFAVSAMVTVYASPDNTVNDRYIGYVTGKAKGGWGLIINEAHAVSKAADGFGCMFGLYDERFLPGQTRLCEEVHKYPGVKLAVQLCHSGRQSPAYQANGIAQAPSPVKDPWVPYAPEEVSEEEIQQIVKDFASAALMAKRAGYDAVEVHGGHGYIVHEFMSPATNKRTDAYGGSLANRMRFPIQIVKAIRKACGPDFPIIYKMSTVEGLPRGEGLGIADSMAIAMMLEEAGVDAIDSSVGNNEFQRLQIAPAARERAITANYAAQLKKVVNIPVFNVGKYSDPFIAEANIVAGNCDVCVMGRQSIADPLFPKKVKEGEFNTVRKCIGCQIGCIAHLMRGEPIACTVNPTVGKEYLYPDKTTDAPKKVVVVGGGIGGMQAAITAAKIGHDVVLFEKSDKLGGQWRLAAVPPFKQEMTILTYDMTEELKKYNVKVSLNTEATAELILAEKPDNVILATGAVPYVANIPGKDGSNVHTAHDVLGFKTIVNGKAAVIGGGEVGVETAAYLAATGIPVVLYEVSDDITVKTYEGKRYYLLEYVREHNIQVRTSVKVQEIKDDAVIYALPDGQLRVDKDFSDIIFATGAVPYNPLEAELKDKVKVQVIGDAIEARQGIDAISEAFDAAYNL